MSFGSQSGRTRSGTKGYSGKERKQKRKKQEYHTHRRAHLHEEAVLDPEAVRARTILALDKLGHQVLSTESGGYDLANWTRNFNSLLDEFQEKMGSASGAEFGAKREEALGYLTPSSTADIDSQIEALSREEAAARKALEDAHAKAAARRSALRDEKEACAKQLKEEREKLEALKKAGQSRGLFSRFKKSGPSIEQAEEGVKKLEAKLASLDEEVKAGRGASPSTGQAEGDQSSLEALRSRIVDLQSSRQSALQVAKERELATKTMASFISSMKLDGKPSGEG